MADKKYGRNAGSPKVNDNVQKVIDNITKRYRVTAREAKDIVRAVKGLEQPAKNVVVQTRETVKAALTGKNAPRMVGKKVNRIKPLGTANKKTTKNRYV